MPPRKAAVWRASDGLTVVVAPAGKIPNQACMDGSRIAVLREEHPSRDLGPTFYLPPAPSAGIRAMPGSVSQLHALHALLVSRPWGGEVGLVYFLGDFLLCGGGIVEGREQMLRARRTGGKGSVT